MTAEDLIAKMEGGEVTNKDAIKRSQIQKTCWEGKKSKWLLPRTVSTQRIMQKLISRIKQGKTIMFSCDFTCSLEG